MGASLGACHINNSEKGNNKPFTSTKPTASPVNKRSVQFKLHIAIDFGTDGCAIAIAYRGQVHIYDKWIGTNRSRTVKTKTHILLNERNKVMNFGNYAKFIYSQLEDNERKTKKFFERFKMALYANDIDADTKEDDIETKQYIHASNGEPLLASIVFIEAFKHLQKKAKKYLFKITKDKISDDEIQWILTVPAIWSEAAKKKMRAWIAEASLVDDNIIDQCIIVYEPDCASLALQKEYFQHIYDNDGNRIYPHPTLIEDEVSEDDMDDIKVQERFEEGDKYILVDAGGGTVDVACHQIMKDGSVEEIIRPTGGDWGSCYIDDLYTRLLNDIFGKNIIDLYKNVDPSEFVRIVDYFQIAKKTFYEDTDNKTHRVQLPFEFVCFLEEQLSKVDRVVEDTVHKYCKSLKYFRALFKGDDDDDIYNNEDITYDDDTSYYGIKLISSNDNAQFKDNDEYLEIDCVIWRSMFDSKIQQIINHIQKLLEKPLLQNSCNYLCFVGGFSSSKYLQQRMRDEFGSKSKYRLKCIIPQKPILSVVEGAAYFGIRKNFIKARKLRYSYGMVVYLTKDTAIKRGISQDHMDKYTTNDGSDMIKNCFHIIAHKDERVAFDEVKLSKTRRVPGKKKAYIQILRSNLQNPKVATDGRLLGSIEVPYTDGYSVMTEFHFYGTMFKVYSYPKSNPSHRIELEITYDA